MIISLFVLVLSTFLLTSSVETQSLSIETLDEIEYAYPDVRPASSMSGFMTDLPTQYDVNDLVVCIRETHVYHAPTCKYVENNPKAYTRVKSDAIERNYKPCPECNP